MRGAGPGAPRSAEGAAILKLHSDRSKRAAELDKSHATRDIKSGADLQRGARLSDRQQVLNRMTPRERKDFLAQPAADQNRMVAASINKVTGTNLLKPTLRTIGTTAYNVGRAAYHDPVGFPIKTGKGLANIAAGVVPGTAIAVSGVASDVVHGNLFKDKGHTAQLGKAIGEDVSKRYGPVFRGEKGASADQLKALRKHGGAQELIDLATTVVPAGKAVVPVELATRTAARTLRGADAATAVRGSLAHMNRPRPDLRVSGGDTPIAVRKQQLAKPGARRYAQRAEDAVRAKRQGRRIAKAPKEPETGIVRAHPLDAEAAGKGQVTPALKSNRVGSAVRSSMGARALARQEGKNRPLFEQARAQVTGEFDKAHRALNKDERKGLKFAMETGVTDAKQARQAIDRRLEQIRETLGDAAPTRREHPELFALEDLAVNADRVFTPKLREQASKLRDLAAKTGVEDPGVKQAAAGRAAAPQAALFGMARKDRETASDFAERVGRIAAKHDLEPGGYFPSSSYQPRGVFANLARGGQAGAIGLDKHYTGALHAKGAEISDPMLLRNQLARNVKRKFNWKFASDVVEHHGFEWARNKSLSQIESEAAKRGVNMGDLYLYAPKRLRDRLAKSAGEGAREMVSDTAEMHGGFDQALFKASDIPEEYRATTRFTALPADIGNELKAAFKPPSKARRVFENVKAKQSQYMLGLNPSWVGFQTIANAMQSGVGGAGLLAGVKGHAFFRKLPEQLRHDIEAEIGVQTRHMEQRVVHLGSTAGRLARGWEAFKLSNAGKVAHVTNVPGRAKDLAFEFDRIQNNFWRRGMAHKELQRIQRMQTDAGLMHQAMGRVVHALRVDDPKGRVREMAKNPEAVEQAATKVRDFLGDWTSFTAKERNGLRRYGLFYGFLRFSLRFAFYTMPTRHPVMSDILAHLGTLHEKEVRDLLGIPDGMDSLPYFTGKIYSKDGKVTFDLSRANPLLNVLTTADSPVRLVSMLPPVVSEAFPALTGLDPFTGKAVKTGTSSERKVGFPGVGNAFRIYLEGNLETAAPYRAYKKAVLTGPQGDTSSALRSLTKPFLPAALNKRVPGEQETKYKRADIVESIAKSKREAAKTSPAEKVRNQLFPVPLPQPSFDRDLAKSLVEADRKKRGKKSSGPVRRRSSYYGSGSGGSYYGGG